MSRFGDDRNLVQEAIGLKRNIRKASDRRKTADPAIVVGYDAANQTVDVRIKTAPDQGKHATEPTYTNVPIHGAGGRDPDIRQILTDDDAGGPTVGMLVFPRCDSREAFIDKDIARPPTKRCHAGRGPVFYPSVPVRTENKPSGLVTGSPGSDDIGPTDRAMVANAGEAEESYIAMKSNGDVVLNQGGDTRLPNVPSDLSGGDTLKLEDGILKRDTSTIRIKEDIQDLQHAERCMDIRARSYTKLGEHQEVGFVAEEAIDAGFEDPVTWTSKKYAQGELTDEYLEKYERDGMVPSGFRYERMTAWHHELIRVLMDRVSMLESRVDELEESAG